MPGNLSFNILLHGLKFHHIDLNKYLPSSASPTCKINLSIESQQPQERKDHCEQQLQVLLVDLRWGGVKG